MTTSHISPGPHSFLSHQGGTKLERCRELFEQCLETCPPKHAKGGSGVLPSSREIPVCHVFGCDTFEGRGRSF